MRSKPNNHSRLYQSSEKGVSYIMSEKLGNKAHVEPGTIWSLMPMHRLTKLLTGVSALKKHRN
eukprot:8593837-Heterocapsa_arctica.AAC.1